MRILREMSGLGSRPYPLDHERRQRVMVALAEKDMTITALAKTLCLPLSLISMVINGRRRSEKSEQLIADFFNKPANYLFPPRNGAEIKKMRQAEAAAKGKTA